jgi:polyphosphate kinase 2 (PPK2 family)
LTILLLLLGAALSDAEELKQATLQAWDAYVQTVNSTMEERATDRSPFLSVDGQATLDPAY